MTDESRSKKLEAAAESLVESISRKTQDAHELYRTHLQTLIASDFIDLNYSLGAFTIHFTGKREAMRELSLLILETIKTGIADNEESYEARKNNIDPSIR